MSVTTTVTQTTQQVTPSESIPVTTTMTIEDSGGVSTTVTRTVNKATPAGFIPVTTTMTITDN